MFKKKNKANNTRCKFYFNCMLQKKKHCELSLFPTLLLVIFTIKTKIQVKKFVKFSVFSTFSTFFF